MDISIIVSVIGVLVALTNVIVQVAKKATYEKMPTNVLALVVAEVLTIVSGIAYLQIKAVPIVWYMIVALIVGGFLVAYAAMFGFDKLKEIMNWGDRS
jgi:hypothetical protein